jgi:RNA polymerase sigma factor (sigma-70 family)
MIETPLTMILRQVRSFAAGREQSGRSDGELLRVFLDSGHESAFEEIVRRHGAMVLGVCRRSLGSLPDAEDAFQATFLLLLRRASSVRKANSLASWLHGVARRVAADARRATTRRQIHERQALPGHAPDPADRAALREVCLVLEEEISRLPATCREPFVLCCLEQLSCAEVAARLNLNEPAVRNRLSRARKMLRLRLTRRGVSLSAAFAAAALVAGGAVPTSLRGSTMTAAAHLAAGGRFASSPVPAAVVALVEGGSRAMSPALVKLVAAAALALGAAVLAVAALQGGKPPDAPKDPPLPVAARPVERQEEKPAVDLHGDPLPPHAVARLGTLRFRGTNLVLQAAAVPGGKQLLGMGFSSTVVLWDATNGKEIRRFEGPTRRTVRIEAGIGLHFVSFGSFAVSPDGKTLAVATIDDSGLDCPMLLFDLATGRKLAEWPGHPSQGRTGYPHLAFVTPTLLVSAGDARVDGSVRVWDVSTQRETRRLALPAGSDVSAIEPSPNRQHVFVAGRDGKEKAFWMAWEAATGKLVHQEMGLPGAFPKLALSPDGGSLALAMGVSDPPKGCTEMRLYSGPEWKERRRWQGHDGDDIGRCAIVFSPDGKTIATGGADEKVRRWDAVTGKEIGPAIEPYQGHSQNVAYLNADTLFTFGWQETVNFWDPTTGKPKLVFLGSESHVTALAYSPDGRHVAVGGEGGEPIRAWEAASGKQVAQLRDGTFDVTCLRFSPDGTSLVSSDYGGAIRRWDWARGDAPVKHVADHKTIVRCFAFSPDGKSMATGDEAGIVRVWVVSTGQLVHTLKGQESQVSALAFTPDGQALLGCSLGDGIRHWNLTTGKEVRLIKRELLGHSNAVNGLAVSPGGSWVYSCSYDGSICIWEAGSGRLARVLKEQEPGYNGPVTIALSHDGTRLAAAFVNDWENLSVHLWDLTTGQKVALTGHREPVTQLAFSPDGHRLASGSGDSTALLWDVTRLGSGGQVPDGKVLAGLWKDLGVDDAKVVYAAVCQSAGAGDAAVAQLKLDFKPAVAIDAEKVAGWVRQLDADEFAQREKASQALADLGPDAETALREALEKAKSPEVRRHLERVLDGQEAEHRRLGHAVEVLEMIGTPAARCLLVDLAKGASRSRLTREARVALDRLEKRP